MSVIETVGKIVFVGSIAVGLQGLYYLFAGLSGVINLPVGIFLGAILIGLGIRWGKGGYAMAQDSDFDFAG